MQFQHTPMLLVEDNLDHAMLAKHSLQKIMPEIELVILHDIITSQKWLERHIPSLLIADFNLPDGQGIEFLTNKKSSTEFPVLIITDMGDEKQANEALRAGALDYIAKTPEMYRDLGRIIHRSIIIWEYLTERQQTENTLRENEAKYQSIFENSPVGILYFDKDSVVTDVNKRLARIIGSPREAMIGLRLLDNPNPDLVKAVQTVLNGKKGYVDGDYQSITSFRIIPMRGIYSPIILEDGTLTGGVGILEDISEQKRAIDLQTSIYGIAQAANHTENMGELYREIHQIIKTLLPADNFYIALWDQKMGTVNFPYYVDQYDENPGVHPFGIGITEYVLRTGQSLLADPQVCEKLEKEGEIISNGTPSVDWLGVPLKDTETNTIGVLVVQSYTEGIRYTESDVDILEYVSTQIAIAIQRKRTEEAEHRQRLLAEALLDTASALNSSLELSEVFKRILINVEKITPFDLALIMLLDGDYAQTISRHGRYVKRKEITDKFFWKDIRGFREIYETAEPLILQDINQYEYWKVVPGGEWIRSYAGIPLIIKGQVIGFLNLNSEKPGHFNPEIVPGLKAFADQASNAIENARLYSEIQQLAILDDLTGLYNRRGLAIFGKREVERAIRFNRDLSILFMDIDDFKLFNDRYSYSTGDEVLRTLAGCLRANLRETDVISRYGGDEFVILLPETNKISAYEISERLRNAIYTLGINANGKKLRISISTGIYSRQKLDKDLESMIESAGEQLHVAKNMGKNRVAMKE